MRQRSRSATVRSRARRAPRRRLGGMRWWILLAVRRLRRLLLVLQPDRRSLHRREGDRSTRTCRSRTRRRSGLQAYQEILSQERPVDPNSQVAQQVREIAQRLIAKTDVVEAALAAEHGQQPQHIARGFEWDVNVIQSDQANAFCLPGGKMAVYTGLMPVAQNADAMAVVMGHEIAHALLRHGAQRMAQQKLAQIGQMARRDERHGRRQQQMVMAAMGYGVLLPYARSHETQADEVGLMLAAAACFNPQEAMPLWERMSRAGRRQAPPEFASTHPEPRHPHPEPAGADAEGDGVPAEVLQPGRQAPPARPVSHEEKRADGPFFCAWKRRLRNS